MKPKIFVAVKQSPLKKTNTSNMTSKKEKTSELFMPSYSRYFRAKKPKKVAIGQPILKEKRNLEKQK